MKRKRFSKAFMFEAVRWLEQRNQMGATLARKLAHELPRPCGCGRCVQGQA